MRTLLRLVFLFVLALVVLLPAVHRVGAADIPTYTVTGWQDGGTGQPTVVVEDQNNFNALWVILGVVSGALIGVPLGLGGGVMLLRRLNDSVPFKDALEHLALSIPSQAAKEIIQEVNKGAQATQDIFKYFMSQYAYPNMNPATAAVLRQLAALGYEGSTLTEAVTDGEPNAPASGGSAVHGATLTYSASDSTPKG